METTPLFFYLYKLVGQFAYPLTWVVISVGFTLILALLPFSPVRQRCMRWSAIFSFSIVITLTNPLVADLLLGTLEAWYPPTLSLKNFDAIVVLGGGVKAPGALHPSVELTETSQYRVTCGAELYRQNRSLKLVVSGGDARIDGHGPILASAMKAWAIRLGVPANAIVEESRSRTTYENAVELKQILGTNASILLVTTAYHIPRAVSLFIKQGFQVTPEPCGFQYGNRPASGEWAEHLSFTDFLPNVEAFDHNTKAIWEILGIIVYWAIGEGRI